MKFDYQIVFGFHYRWKGFNWASDAKMCTIDGCAYMILQIIKQLHSAHSYQPQCHVMALQGLTWDFLLFNTCYCQKKTKMHNALFREGKLYVGTEYGNISEWNIKITRIPNSRAACVTSSWKWQKCFWSSEHFSCYVKIHCHDYWRICIIHNVNLSL